MDRSKTLSFLILLLAFLFVSHISSPPNVWLQSLHDFSSYRQTTDTFDYRQSVGPTSTTSDLEDLDIHVTIKDVDEFCGVSAFWTKDPKSFWRRTDVAESGVTENLAATVVLDLPKFSKNTSVELFGTIIYKIEELTLQTLIPKITLRVDEITIGEHYLNFICEKSDIGITFDKNVQFLLSVKSLSIEKITNFRLTEALNENFSTILRRLDFKEIIPKVFAGQSAIFEHCVLEISSASALKYKSFIYSRSVTQLNLLLQNLHDALPEETTITCVNINAEDVTEAIETELNSYLKMGNTFEIQKNIVKSDLAIQEFENNSTIYKTE